MNLGDPLTKRRKMEPEKLMEGLSTELSASLKALAKAKTVEEKVQLSIVVKNLSDALGVFLKVMAEMMPYDEYEED